MTKSSLYILPISSVVFPYHDIKLLIPETSTYYNKSLTNSFIGVIVTFEKTSKQNSTTTANSNIGTVLKVLREVYINGGISEQSKVIYGVAIKRFQVQSYQITTPYKLATVNFIDDEITETQMELLESQGTIRKLRELGEKYVTHSSKNDYQVSSRVEFIKTEKNLFRLSYTIASYLEIPKEDKQKLLEVVDLEKRLKLLLSTLSGLASLIDADTRNSQKLKNPPTKRQELERMLFGKTNKKELQALEEKIMKGDLPEKVLEEAKETLKRLSQMNAMSAEYPVQIKYLETLLALPWKISSKENKDINHAEKILNRDHAGLDKVKKRILEEISVRILTENSKGSIICFQGPPGVGKTSLGKSIAESLGRKFERVALGGIRDESEIRGHRRTYIGSMPGRIIQAILRCKTNNPVILLDEIDKIAHNSFSGDPSSALLEVLDPNQNDSFTDHYIGTPFDLSNVLFIATANGTESIHPALIDRMEVINLSGYTINEKLEIALHYLVPRQIQKNGLKKGQVVFSPEAIEFAIKCYTQEAGVRNLERTIGSLCRKIAFETLRFEEDEKNKKDNEAINTSVVSTSAEVTIEFIKKTLGPPFIEDEFADRIILPGIAIGMAWTQFGGKILLVEASKSKGKGNIEITGHLGDVMKESVRTALSYIKSNLVSIHQDQQNKNSILFNETRKSISQGMKANLGDKENALDSLDIHIHFPAAAIPKDGPSAGITITVALISLLTGRRVRSDLAMTGEISLKGRVLPVGGIKEKCLAAYNAGIKNIIIPSKNQKDTEEIIEEIRNNIKFHFVKSIDEVLEIALEPSSPEINASILGIPESFNKLSKL